MGGEKPEGDDLLAAIGKAQRLHEALGCVDDLADHATLLCFCDDAGKVTYALRICGGRQQGLLWCA